MRTTLLAVALLALLLGGCSDAAKAPKPPDSASPNDAKEKPEAKPTAREPGRPNDSVKAASKGPPDSPAGQVHLFNIPKQDARVAFPKDGRRIVCVSESLEVFEWDTATAKQVRHTPPQKGKLIAISSDFRRALSVIRERPGEQETFYLWDLDSGKAMGTWSGPGGDWDPMSTNAAFSPDGGTVLCLHRELPFGKTPSGGIRTGRESVSVWNTDTGKEDLPFRELGSPFVFSRNGKQVATARGGSSVSLTNLKTGELVRRFPLEPEDHPHSLVFSPDGGRLLAGCARYKGDRHTLLLWDVSTGKLLHSFPGHEGYIQAVAFSPDGRRILSGAVRMSYPRDDKNSAETADFSVRLWDATTGKTLFTFEGHKAGVNSVAFSPDGSLAVSASGADKTVRLWRLPK